MQRTALYRHKDADGRLLYVGVSNDVMYRTDQHHATSVWFDSIAMISVDWFDSRAECLDAERMAILVEQPIYNRSGNRPHRAASPSSDLVRRLSSLVELAMASNPTDEEKCPHRLRIRELALEAGAYLNFDELAAVLSLVAMQYHNEGKAISLLAAWFDGVQTTDGVIWNN